LQKAAQHKDSAIQATASMALKDVEKAALLRAKA
jgi:hypothetical protein